MKEFSIMKYAKKFLPLILVFCFLATGVIYYQLKESNKYIASEVIHYNDEQAEQGLAPTGVKLDVNEIKSSAVVSKVVERMGLTGIYSVDSLISRISITPIPDEDKMAQKQAKLEEGEDYIYEPSTFIVSFAATSAEGSEFARKIIDETLDVYFAEYSQKYVNVAPVNNTVKNITSNDYDYIEMLELIDDGLGNTLQSLYKIVENENYYRATTTGESFADLADEFSYIRSVKLSRIFSKVYKYQITRDKNMLVSDYTTRIDNNNIKNEKETQIVDDLVKVIDEYVEKMRVSGNTNITSEYILENLHDKSVVDTKDNPIVKADQTVTYDELIYAWRDHNEIKEHAIIDSAYCQYILDTFQKCSGECENNECASSGKTCTELHNPDYKEIEKEIDTEINELVDELTRLYDITTKTNDEYNEYIGASYISVLSTSSVKESINVKLYTLIAFFFLMVLCFGGAIVLGRITDIINYIFYTDHMTGFSNRAYFDKFLKSMDKNILDDGFVYCVTDISNLVSINASHGRETGDDVIKMFAALLKECFGKSKAKFIYNDNGSFIVTVTGSDYITVEDIMGLFRTRLDEREEHSDVAIEYKIGIAETFKDNKTARKLFSAAIRSKKSYVSDLSISEQ